MCKYCETETFDNEFGRRFGEVFPMDLNYDLEVQLSWDMKKGIKTNYNIYMYDEENYNDVSVPIHYCSMCGRKLGVKND